MDLRRTYQRRLDAHDDKREAALHRAAFAADLERMRAVEVRSLDRARALAAEVEVDREADKRELARRERTGAGLPDEPETAPKSTAGVPPWTKAKYNATALAFATSLGVRTYAEALAHPRRAELIPALRLATCGRVRSVGHDDGDRPTGHEAYSSCELWICGSCSATRKDALEAVLRAKWAALPYVYHGEQILPDPSLATARRARRHLLRALARRRGAGSATQPVRTILRPGALVVLAACDLAAEDLRALGFGVRRTSPAHAAGLAVAAYDRHFCVLRLELEAGDAAAFASEWLRARVCHGSTTGRRADNLPWPSRDELREEIRRRVHERRLALHPDLASADGPAYWRAFIRDAAGAEHLIGDFRSPPNVATALYRLAHPPAGPTVLRRRDTRLHAPAPT